MTFNLAIVQLVRYIELALFSTSFGILVYTFVKVRVLTKRS